jgi:hypothetical protein
VIGTPDDLGYTLVGSVGIRHTRRKKFKMGKGRPAGANDQELEIENWTEIFHFESQRRSHHFDMHF